MNAEYEVIRSRRKTISLEIKDARLIVRAPLRLSEEDIRNFLVKHRKWIEIHLEKARERQNNMDPGQKLTEAELKSLAEEALRVIPGRVAHYAALIGVTYGRITIRNQRTRWGSCSSKGNLNFNCLLMLAPPEVLDSVIVHELCHRKEMNHSDRFYAEVLRACPDYWKWNRWLKEHGDELIGRMI